ASRAIFECPSHCSRRSRPRHWPRVGSPGRSGSIWSPRRGCSRRSNGFCISGDGLANGRFMNDTSLALELTHPLRLICLAVVPVLLYYFYRSLVDFPRWQRSVSLAIRTLIVILLVLALAGLTLLKPTTEQYVIFAVDRSTSVGEESSKAADKFIDDALTEV